MKRREIKFTHFLIVFSVCVVTLLLGVIGAILYVKTEAIIEEKFQLIHDLKLNQTAADVRKQFEDTYQSLDSFRNNKPFTESLRTLESGQLTAYQRVIHSQELETSLLNFKRSNSFIEEIVALTPEGIYSSNQRYGTYFLSGRRIEPSMEKGQIHFVPPGASYGLFRIEQEKSMLDPELRQVLDELDRTPYFIAHFGGQGEGHLGMMILKLDMEALYKKIPYAGSIAILGQDAKVLFEGMDIEAALSERIHDRTGLDPNPQQGSYRIEGSRYTVREIGFNGLKLVFSEPMTGFHEEQVRLITRYSILALVGSLLLSYLFARIIGKKILYPLHGLIRWTRSYDRLEERWDAPRQRARRISMRERFFLYFLITILLPSLLFVSLFYIQSTRIVARELQETYYALFEKTVHRVELFVRQKEGAMTWLAYDTTIGNFALHPDSLDKEEMDQLVFARTISALNPDTVSIYSRDNRLLYTNGYRQSPMIDSALYEDMRQQRKRIFYYLPPVETGSSTISLSMSIFDVYESSDVLGMLKTDIDGVYFSSLFAELNAEETEAFIVNDEGRVLSHTELEKIGQTLQLPLPPSKLNGHVEEGDASIYFAGQIGDLPWYLVTVNDSSLIWDQALGLIYDDIYILIIVFLLVLILSYGMSQYLVRPLSTLQNRFFRVYMEGAFPKLDEGTYTIDEVEQLRLSFNRLLERIEQLVDERLRGQHERLVLELEKKSSQIEALQAQINPHFLHNTLENVMYLIEEGEQERAIELIGLISRLFRYSMGKESPHTTVREEVAYAKAYLRIMSLRYKDRITCEWEVEEALLECSMIKMLLQPIIENAIRHTLETPSASIAIQVTVRQLERDLYITVQDNGPGFSGDQLEHIYRQLKNPDRRNVGLYNVHGRIQLHFGEPYGLTAGNHEKAGAVVTLKLPILSEEKGERA